MILIQLVILSNYASNLTAKQTLPHHKIQNKTTGGRQTEQKNGVAIVAAATNPFA